MQLYLIFFAITLLASLAFVTSSHWHGRLSLDNAFDVQNHYPESPPRIGGLEIDLGVPALPVLWLAAIVNDTAMLGLAVGISVFCYAAVFVHPTKCRWCFSATALKTVIAVSLWQT